MPSQFLAGLSRATRAFMAARGGNVSLLFGFSLVPLIGLTGLGVDYGIAFSAKTKLDNAADAAVLAAVATAKAYVAANPTDTNVTADAVAAGLDRAKRAFAVNAGAISFASVPTPTITLTRTGQTFSANASYRTSAAAQFGRLFGQTSLAITGSSAASADVPSYLDFYILIDESGSMGIPTTSADQAALAQVNGTCQFACHFADAKLAKESLGNWGYNIATTGYTKKAKGDGTYINDKQVLPAPVQLRSGAVNNALCKLLSRAASPAVAKQYRVGLYPFIAQIGVLSTLTTDIASLQKTADCASTPPMALTSLLDAGVTQFYTGGDPTTGVGSGGTHFDLVLPSMNAMVSPIGDGSSATNPKPYVFLITDGMDNDQRYASKSGSSYRYVGDPNTQFTSYTGSDGKTPATSSFDGSKPKTIDLSNCSLIKSAGVTLSVLYIPYVPLLSGNGNKTETKQVNDLIPSVASTLQSCASPGFFYAASSDSDITASLNAMFNQAVQVAHLSK